MPCKHPDRRPTQDVSVPHASALVASRPRALPCLPSSAGSSTSGTAARQDLAQAVAGLVATLARAHALAGDASDDSGLAALLVRARAELDVADEKLLALDRHRERSAFRQAGRIRARLDALEVRIESGITAVQATRDSEPPAAAAG